MTDGKGQRFWILLLNISRWCITLDFRAIACGRMVGVGEDLVNSKNFLFSPRRNTQTRFPIFDKSTIRFRFSHVWWTLVILEYSTFRLITHFLNFSPAFMQVCKMILEDWFLLCFNIILKILCYKLRYIGILNRKLPRIISFGFSFAEFFTGSEESLFSERIVCSIFRFSPGLVYFSHKLRSKESFFIAGKMVFKF